MSKHLISPLILGLAFAAALPMGAAGTHHLVLMGQSKETAGPKVVHVQAPKAPARRDVRHQAARAKAPRPVQRPINLNTATVTELMQLPRVGMGTAERIVAFRKEHGEFKRIEEVMNIKGVGEKSFAKLRPFLFVSTSVK